MNATAPITSAQRLAQDAEDLLRHPGASISVVGKKPWYRRALSDIAGAAPTLLFYAAALFPLSLNQTQEHKAEAPTVEQSAKTVTEALGIKPMLMSRVDIKPIWERADAPSKAAFEVPEGMSSQQVVQKLFSINQPFQALAVTLEGLETKPYRDGCGLNVGMGYCIDARVRENGPIRVRQDLTDAGLSLSQVDTLMGNDRKAQTGIELTRTQALALLGLTENDYRVRARDLVGQQVFDRLPSNRQAVLTWLSYNTGDGLARFNRLLTAVRQDKPSEAVQHMTPFFSQGGQMVPNARAGSWLMAAYWSNDAMKAAFDRPDALEHGSRQGRSPLEVVAPHEAGKMALRGLLPESPYVVHGVAKLTTVAVQEAQQPVVLPSQEEWRAQRQAAKAQQTPVQAPVVSAPQPAQHPAFYGQSHSVPQPTQPQQENQAHPLGANPAELFETLPSQSRPKRPGMR